MNSKNSKKAYTPLADQIRRDREIKEYPEEIVNYSEYPKYIMHLKSNKLAPWEENYFHNKKNSNIIQLMLDINPGYLEEHPKLQYYMRIAYLEGELSIAKAQIDQKTVINENGETVEIDTRLHETAKYLDEI